MCSVAVENWCSHSRSVSAGTKLHETPSITEFLHSLSFGKEGGVGDNLVERRLKENYVILSPSVQFPVGKLIGLVWKLL